MSGDVCWKGRYPNAADLNKPEAMADLHSVIMNAATGRQAAPGAHSINSMPPPPAAAAALPSSSASSNSSSNNTPPPPAAAATVSTSSGAGIITQQAQQKCSWCNQTSSVKLQRCSKCHQSYYCNSDCQRAAWSTHKIKCSTTAKK
jgi:hypothetical protein